MIEVVTRMVKLNENTFFFFTYFAFCHGFDNFSIFNPKVYEETVHYEFHKKSI